MVLHRATEIGFISRTGSTQTRDLRRMVRLSRNKYQVGVIRVAPGRTRQDWCKFARFGTVHNARHIKRA